MIIISGCSRSGTSLTMDLLRTALGDDSIVGDKFPQEANIEKFMKRREEETDNEYEARIYEWKARNPYWEKDLAESKDMNPNGFWECKYSVRGIFDPPSHIEPPEHQKELLVNGKNKVCKIVSQGLANSDPKYIDKIVLLLRHPAEVAKSQERLKRDYPARFQEGDTEFRVHTPQMFIRVTYALSKWLLKNPDIPILFVHHSDLVSKPQEAIDAIKDFVGLDGDWGEAVKRVEPKLYRSLPEERKEPIWEDAIFVWDKICDKKYQDIVDYFEDTKKERATQRENKSWFCPRYGSQVNDNMCKMCRTNSVVRNNYKKTAESRNIDWEKEPCLYEVAYGPQDVVKISISESIKNNFWIEDEDGSNEPAKIAEAKLEEVKDATQIGDVNTVENQVIKQVKKNCSSCNRKNRRKIKRWRA